MQKRASVQTCTASKQANQLDGNARENHASQDACSLLGLPTLSPTLSDNPAITKQQALDVLTCQCSKQSMGSTPSPPGLVMFR